MARHSRAKRGIPSENDGMHHRPVLQISKEWHRRYPAENFVKICFFSPQNNVFDSKRISTKIQLRIFSNQFGKHMFISDQARRLGNSSFSKLKISQKHRIENLSSLEFVENTNKDAFATALVKTLSCKYMKCLFSLICEGGMQFNPGNDH